MQVSYRQGIIRGQLDSNVKSYLSIHKNYVDDLELRVAII